MVTDLSEGRPKWASFCQVNEGGEPLHFRSCFREWLEAGSEAAARGFAARRETSLAATGVLGVVSPELEAERRTPAAPADLRRAIMAVVLSILNISWHMDASSSGAGGAALAAAVRTAQQRKGGDPIANRLSANDGAGRTATWLISGGELVPLPPKDEGTLFADQTYLILFLAQDGDGNGDVGAANEEEYEEFDEGLFGGFAADIQSMKWRLRRRSAAQEEPLAVLYLWRGERASPASAAAWNLSLRRSFMESLDKARGGSGSGSDLAVVDVQQRLEPDHFHRAFAGRLVLCLAVDAAPDPRHLFHVRNGVASEIGATVALCPRDIYLLLILPVEGSTEAALFIWIGPGCDQAEQAAGSALASHLIEQHGLDVASRVHLVAAARAEMGDEIWAEHQRRRGGDDAASHEAEAVFWEVARGLAAPPDGWVGPAVQTCGGAAERGGHVAAYALVATGSTTGDVPLFQVRGVSVLQMHCLESGLLLLDDPDAPRTYLWAGARVPPSSTSLALRVATHWADATASARRAKDRDRRAWRRDRRDLARATSFDPAQAAALGQEAAGSEDEGEDEDGWLRREVVLVRQGREPPGFCGCFHGWATWDRFQRPAFDDPWERRRALRSGDGHIVLGKVVLGESSHPSGAGSTLPEESAEGAGASNCGGSTEGGAEGTNSRGRSAGERGRGASGLGRSKSRSRRTRSRSVGSSAGRSAGARG